MFASSPMAPELESNLLEAMRTDNLNHFRELVQQPDFTDSTIDKCLLVACSNIRCGEYLDLLLHLGADPNTLLTYRSFAMPALHVAAASNNPVTVEILLKDERTRVQEVDGTGRTALHHAVIPGKDEHVDRAKQCVRLLLGELHRPESSHQHLLGCTIDVDALDAYQSTALHYAAKYGDEDMILALLQNGAYIGVKDRNGTPILDIGPTTLETFLDECLKTKNAKSPNEYMYTLIFTFYFLPQHKNQICSKYSQVRMFEMPTDEGTTPYCFTSEMDTLFEISQLKHMRYLLKHPVITLFLNIKWHRIKAIFYLNICFYTCFLVLLNYHIISRPFKNCDDDCGGQLLIKSLLTCFLILLMLREVFQFIISCRKYIVTPGNYLTGFLIIFTIASLTLPPRDPRQHISAVTILLSWTELFLLTGNIPVLSIQLEMLKKVCLTFLRFMTWYSILIFGFSFSFCILLNTGQDYKVGSVHSFFLDPGRSVFKTVIMMTGEFDAVDLPFSSFPVTSHVVFLLFVFLIAIVLLNLLNGLAVSDTQAIKDQAEVYSLVSRVKTISYIETSLLNLKNSRFLQWTTRLPLVWLLYKNIFIFPFFCHKKEICVYPNWKENNVVIGRPNDANDYFHLRNWSFKTTLSAAIKILINKKKVNNMNAMKMYLELKQTQVEIQKMFDSFEERIMKTLGRTAQQGARKKSKKRKLP